MFIEVLQGEFNSFFILKKGNKFFCIKFLAKYSGSFYETFLCLLMRATKKFPPQFRKQNDFPATSVIKSHIFMQPSKEDHQHISGSDGILFWPYKQRRCHLLSFLSLTSLFFVRSGPWYVRDNVIRRLVPVKVNIKIVEPAREDIMADEWYFCSSRMYTLEKPTSLSGFLYTL